MYGTIATAALLGLSTLASARPSNVPVANATANGVNVENFAQAAAQANSSAIGVNDIAKPASTSSSSAAPSQSVFDYNTNPVGDGFPSNKNVAQIQVEALGTLPSAAPNAPAGTPPKQESLDALAFVAFNELFEVSFFTTLIDKIQKGEKGFQESDLLGLSQAEAIRVLKVINAQEELHELNAAGALAKFKQAPITPCEYLFPAENFTVAISLASTFTDVVLSTLPEIQFQFAKDQDNGLIRGVGSVIGQEGEQNGFFHEILKEVPSQLPFLTGGARAFAFNAILQNFVAGGSCSPLTLGQLKLKTFDVFTPEDPTVFNINQDITADFILESFNPGLIKNLPGQNLVAQQAPKTSSGQFVTYINQQNAPISVPIISQEPIDGTLQVRVKASFPGKTHDLNGLTIGVITNGNNFADIDSVALATVFGPALIEVNQPISTDSSSQSTGSSMSSGTKYSGGSQRNHGNSRSHHN